MRNLKLHHILVVCFTLISAVPVLFLAIWVQRSALEKEIAAVEEKHLLIARNLGGALSRYSKDVESGFRLAVENLSKMRKVDGLERLLASLQFEHVCIADKQGSVKRFVAVSPAINFTRIPDKLFKDLQPFRDEAAKTPGKVFFSDVLPDAEGRPRIFLVKGLPEDQIAIGAITTDYLVAVQKAITFGDKGHAAIVDRRGRVLAHPNPAWRRQMRDISAVEPVARMKAGETGVTTFYSPATKSKMIAGFTTVPGVGWGAMIPQPYSELEDRAKDVRLLALAIALGGILVAALISWWLARFLAVPIQAVVRFAREVAGGDSTSRVRVESRFAPMELRELSESFNQMVTQVGAETGKTAKMIAQRNEVVERLAGGASLDTVLRLLVEIAQDLDSGMLGSVFLLDRDRKRLLLGAAPSLPDFYNDAIDGLEIGPTVGSCGAAAYGGERVVVGDVMTHPNWVKFRDLALRAGLRACWSEPIKSASGETLGTFALYYREPREPNEAELKRIVDAANLAGIAITRARTEEALMASEAQYRAIVENQTELICRFLPNGKYTFANDAYCRYHKTSREELIGTDAVFSGSDHRTLEGLLANLGANRPVQTSEQNIAGPDGEVVWQQWTDHALCDAQGKIVEIQSVGHDITALKQAEARLNQSQRMEALGKLTGGVAHEFNNVLQIIGGYAEMLEQGVQEMPELVKFVKTIENAVNRGADLTQRFQAFGHKQLLKPQLVRLGEVVEETADMVRMPLGPKIELGTSVVDGVWDVLADKSHLENAILNMAINARDAMPSGGKLDVRVENVSFDEGGAGRADEGPKGDFVVLSVSDTGVGMTPDVRERVFEPFYTTKGQAEHTGLGLSMVYGFVTQTGGHVEIKSEPGVGTTIRLYLPRALGA